MRSSRLFTLSLVAVVLGSGFSTGRVAAQTILFVRGADRSGGFLEAGNDSSRTEHLADITNFATFRGNHGWGELASILQEEGFLLDQVAEPVESGASRNGQTNGAQLDFGNLTTGKQLADYDAVVFGSNNAIYDNSQVSLIESYIREGGGALFISDANFGSDWGDAPNSDQQFLDRFGIEVLQDQGTYSLTRSAGDFDVPDHPIFENVDRFDGEGVSPFRIVDNKLSPGVDAIILANAEGRVRNNDRLGVGSSRQANLRDAALFAATADLGRIVGHYDRNTFFNNNGAGTNINRFDNKQFAINLFSFITNDSSSCNADTMGDINGDGKVAFDDFLLLSSNFGNAVDDHTMGDIDCDGLVAFADFLILSANFGRGVDVLAIPEADGSAMMIIAAIIMLRMRSRRHRSIQQALRNGVAPC